MQNIMMPNFMEELVEDDDGQLQSTAIFAHSHLNDTQTAGARLGTTSSSSSRKKRNLPGNPGKLHLLSSILIEFRLI